MKDCNSKKKFKKQNVRMTSCKIKWSHLNKKQKVNKENKDNLVVL